MNARANFMPILGGIILLAVALYFGFQALDGSGLATRAAAASVLGKRYRPAGVTYRTELTGGVTRSIPYSVPEAYLLKLRIGGAETEAAVNRDLYQSVGDGDKVAVTYRQRRFTGGLQVLAVKHN